MSAMSSVPDLHPIFTLPDSDRYRHIQDNVPLSICLHELGHLLVARHFRAPFASVVLPHFGSDVAQGATASMPATVVNMRGLDQAAKLGICVAGYAGELCLFEKNYLQRNGKIHVCVAACANDAAEIVSIGRLPVGPPREEDDIQRILVNCIRALKFRPYNILYDNIIGFRHMVTRLHERWQALGFRAMAVTADALD